MGSEERALMQALNVSVQELQDGINTHCGLVTALMQGKLDVGDLQSLVDRCPKRSREVRLEKAVMETIDILEESRKAFKSKRLEMLRKKLTQLLVDA